MSSFLCFPLILCQSEFLFEGERWIGYLLCLIVRSQSKFALFHASASSDKLGICHVCRPVSRDRRILVMELEAGKAAHVAYLLLIF